MSYFQGTEVPKALQEELKERGIQLSNQGNRKYLWAASRQNWFKLTSMAQVQSKAPLATPRFLGNESLPETIIGGAYSRNSLRPAQPAIKSIKVKQDGQLGSTRKATVDVEFFTDEQLSEWEPYLFVPGMSIRLEWGWNVGANNNNPIGPINYGFLKDQEAVSLINKQAENNPNYDGFQGRVVNFSFDLQKDIWVGTLELVAAGKGVTMKPINDTSCGCSCKEENEDGDEAQEPKSNIEAFLLAANEVGTARGDVADKNRYRDIVRTIKLSTGKEPDTALVRFNAIDRNRKGEQDSTGEGMETTTEEMFISLQTLADIINNTTGNFSKDGKPVDGIISFMNPEKKFGESNLIPALNGLASVDPYVCILPGQWEKLQAFVSTTSTLPKKLASSGLFAKNQKTRSVQGARNSIQYPASFEDDFIVSEQPLNSLITPAQGKIANILVSTKHIYKIYKQNEKGTLADMLLALLNSINDVCGDFWEFAIVDVSDRQLKDQKPNYPCILTVLDTKGAETKQRPFEIRTKPDDPQDPNEASVVREMSLQSKLTDQMKTQALYAGPPKGNAANNCDSRFVYLRDNSAETVKVVNLGGESNTKPASDCCPETDECEKDERLPSQKFADAFALLLSKRKSGDRVDAAKTALRELLRYIEGTSGKSPACPTIAYPFELTMTLDGIGGFVWGQYITTDRLPKRYTYSQNKDNFVWQITTVEHDITDKDWTTSVNTLLRYLGNS